MCKIQMRPDRVYRTNVLQTLSNDSNRKEKKKRKRDNEGLYLFCIMVLKKAASQQKTIYIKVSNTFSLCIWNERSFQHRRFKNKSKASVENMKLRKSSTVRSLFVVFQLVGQPIESFIEAIAACGARGLNVPVPVPERMQPQLVRDFRSVHGVR